MGHEGQEVLIKDVLVFLLAGITAGLRPATAEALPDDAPEREMTNCAFSLSPKSTCSSLRSSPGSSGEAVTEICVLSPGARVRMLGETP